MDLKLMYEKSKSNYHFVDIESGGGVFFKNAEDRSVHHLNVYKNLRAHIEHSFHLKKRIEQLEEKLRELGQDPRTI